MDSRNLIRWVAGRLLSCGVIAGIFFVVFGGFAVWVMYGLTYHGGK